MLAQQRDIKTLQKDMRTQQAKALGPTLGEFYGMFQGLPGLRGLWYPGSQDQAGALYDQSGQGRTLTYAGNPTLNTYASLIPYEDYDGTGDAHFRADEAGLDIIGNETTMAASIRGLTLGGWWWFNNNTGVQTCLSKVLPGDIAYYIRNNAGTIQFSISNTGVALLTASLAGTVAGQWYFLAGRFTPSTEVKLWVNDTKVSNVTSIPATLKNSASKLVVAGFDNGAGGYNELLTGRCAVAFLCSALLSDTLIATLFNRSRPLFSI